MVKNIYHDIRNAQRNNSVSGTHVFLVRCGGVDEGLERIRTFFSTYQLLRYRSVNLTAEEPLFADSPHFWDSLAAKTDLNKARIRGLVGDLQHEGLRTLDDLIGMETGHLSNTVHTIAHLLDSFFGIDSCFFNLVDESHWVTDGLKEEIRKNPSLYLLLPVKGLL